ncbi:hypothetical protein SELMODRAFT_407821 [Selaginella moellendorffii]|uniref:Uncharacterized protein n=1 Tax=Selaginella moellendorffii TaxID=88036 RepID=D8R4V4_SELML|nr:hypothetical protein SELMODRAFT_407821 [Selaginella moellendorffii]
MAAKNSRARVDQAVTAFPAPQLRCCPRRGRLQSICGQPSVAPFYRLRQDAPARHRRCTDGGHGDMVLELKCRLMAATPMLKLSSPRSRLAPASLRRRRPSTSSLHKACISSVGAWRNCEGIKHWDKVFWTLLTTGYVENKQMEMALDLLAQMEARSPCCEFRDCVKHLRQLGSQERTLAGDGSSGKRQGRPCPHSTASG